MDETDARRRHDPQPTFQLTQIQGDGTRESLTQSYNLVDAKADRAGQRPETRRKADSVQGRQGSPGFSEIRG